MHLLLLASMLGALVQRSDLSGTGEKGPRGTLLLDVSGKHPAEFIPAAFSPDGKSVAISFQAKKVIGLWDTGTGDRRCLLTTRDAVSVNTGVPSPAQLAFSADSRSLAATLGTLYHGHIVVWDLRTARPSWGKAEVARVHSFPLAFAPDGAALLTGGRPTTHRKADVTFWGTANGEVLRAVGIGIPGALEVKALAFTADGKRWATTHLVENASGKGSGWSSMVSIWQNMADKPDRTWLATSGHVQALVFAANSDTLIGRCAFPDHIEVWDCRKGLLRLTLPLGDTADLAVAVSPDGRTLTAVAGEGLRQWDLATGRPRGHPLRAPGRVLSLSPDGKLVLTLARDENLRISNVSSLSKE